MHDCLVVLSTVSFCEYLFAMEESETRNVFAMIEVLVLVELTYIR